MSEIEPEEPILIVESEPVFGDLIEAYLGSRGYRVRRVADGRRALEVLASHSFAAVVAGLDLPGLDGLELAASAAELDGAPPFVLVTWDGALAKLDGSSLERLGLAEVIQRPCRLGSFVESIERITGHRAQRPSITLAMMRPTESSD